TQQLDRHGPAEGLVDAAPHLAHASGRDPAVQPVAAVEDRVRRDGTGEGLRRSGSRSTGSVAGRDGNATHLWTSNAACMTLRAPGAPTAPPVRTSPPPTSTMTATATLGALAGAKPTNQAWGAVPLPCSAVPVLPATFTPWIWALVPVPFCTTLSIIVVSCA